MKNPFKFGTVVEKQFFTDRINEFEEAKQVLSSNNHLIIISPRRFGKTSLIHKVTQKMSHPVLFLDLQLLTDVPDFASQLLKRILKISKWEKVKHFLTTFKVVPAVSINPLTNEIDITFQPTNNSFAILEDVLNLIEKIGEKSRKIIVVLDEFQEIKNLDKNLDKQLRSVIQHHQHVNYVFLGSLESMMKTIFESKKSPFYHFGHVMYLQPIPYPDFFKFLTIRFREITSEAKLLSENILQFSGCHPYYTQQLAFHCWNYLEKNQYHQNMLGEVIDNVVIVHSNDYERLWNTINKTDKKILIELATKKQLPLRELTHSLPTSTIYSGIKRLIEQGYIIKQKEYELDDPFFRFWILQKREE